MVHIYNTTHKMDHIFTARYYKRMCSYTERGSRDGTLRLWDPETLSIVKKRNSNKLPVLNDREDTVRKDNSEDTWFAQLSQRAVHNPLITDVQYMPWCNKVLVSSDDR